MIYYPVVIPTLNRYTHFRRCVESLARNTYADQTELVIGLDFPPAEKYVEGYRQIKDYLPTITGFKKVTVFERTENWGPVKNNQALIDYVFANYDAVITTEDDNEFSPCFLDYMNQMLNHYRDDRRIATVSAYLPALFAVPSASGLLFSQETNAWGYGCWRDKYADADERINTVKRMLGSWRSSLHSFLAYPACFRMAVKMASKGKYWGDVIRTQCNIANGTYQVRPAVSLSRNWGYDGSGVNCTVDTSMAYQPLSEAVTFDTPNDWEPFFPQAIAKATFRLSWPKSNLKFAAKLAITIVLYIRYRLSHRR
jgi:glycosyltransferase involved in cell wall biosynthesis